MWQNNRQSFYCGCEFDESLEVNYASCGYMPVNEERAHRIEWEHLVPVSWFGHRRPCWQYAKKNGLNPRTHCEKHDKIFKKMHNDLHNLVPAVGEINQARGAYGFGLVENPHPFNGCNIAIDCKNKKVEPKDSIKGVIARAHLYMEKQYGRKQFKLSHAQRKQYKIWDLCFPPLEWEKQWNANIFPIQKTDNKWISQAREP